MFSATQNAARLFKIPLCEHMKALETTSDIMNLHALSLTSKKYVVDNEVVMNSAETLNVISFFK